MNLKILSLINSFTKHEQNRFVKFVGSGYFNENRTLTEFLSTLLTHATKSEATSKEVIWKSHFKEKKFEDTKFRRLCSDLYKLAEKFIVIEAINNDPQNHDIQLLKAFRKRRLNKNFQAAFKRSSKLQQTKPRITDDFFLDQYFLEREYYDYLDTKGGRSQESNLEALSYNLDCFYLVKKLKHCCQAINFKNVFKAEINIRLIDDLLVQIDNSEFANVPLIKVYRLIFKILTNLEDDQSFNALMASLEEYNESIAKEDLWNMYRFAINYCIKKVNTGKLDWFNVLFEIFKKLINQEIIFRNGVLGYDHYKNIITVGIQVKELDWTEKFIREYIGHVPKKHQENAFSYNLAKVYFEQKEYEKVIESLRSVAYEDVFYALGSRWLLVKTYLELDEFEPLDALIDSFRIYLLRNRQINRDIQRSYLNTIKVVQKLIRLPIHDTNSIDRLEVKIKDTKVVHSRKWLLEKLNSFRK